MAKKRRTKTQRLSLLDTIRGLTLCSMILYHLSWDLVYMVGIDWPWYHTAGAFYWQQSICWTFILLSGLCIPLSHHRIRRGFVVSLCGVLVTVVTLAFAYEDRVIFGVLTLIGACMILTGLLYRGLCKIPRILGIVLFGYLFYLTRWINAGYLQLYPGKEIALPSFLYQGYAMTFLGFQAPEFYSTDYFSLMPWFFLYLVGVYLGRLLFETKAKNAGIFRLSIPPLSFMGRHSLLIYLAHQPVITGILVLIARYAGSF